MRIALVTDCYGPRMGGIETQVAGLAERLRIAGHQVLVITATPGSATCGVLRLPSPVPIGVPINPRASPALRQALAGADVVHVHLGVLAPFAQMAVSAAREADIPTVVTWHSLVASSPLTPVLRQRWRAWVCRGAIPSAVSTVGARQLATVLGGRHVDLMRNGISIDRWTGDPARGAGMQVISAMRFTPGKRPVRLLTMLAAARAGMSEKQRPRLTICGDGVLLKPLRRLVATTSMREWVELPGRLSSPALADRYGVSHLYVAPARHEAFGIAALEAAAAGLPVLAYAGSGVQDIAGGGEGGLLVDTDRDMVRLLAELARQPARLRSMAAYQRSHPPIAHQWSSVEQDTVALYRRAISAQ